MSAESAEVFSSGEQPLLFEREEDLAALDAALTEAVAGTGGVRLIEGPAGIGKTVLLDAMRRRAAVAEMRVLTARGGELERGFGFGIVRQLLEGALMGADLQRLVRDGKGGPARPRRQAAGGSTHRSRCDRGPSERNPTQ